MKAITLWQPFASAIAVGQKHFETRSWSTKYRGPLAIHAAARQVVADGNIFTDKLAELHQLDFEAWTSYCDCQYELLPFGEIVATCDVVACIRVEEIFPGETEKLWGNFSPGRWAWSLENIRPVSSPLPAVGRQGLWDFEMPEHVGEIVQLSLL